MGAGACPGVRLTASIARYWQVQEKHMICRSYLFVPGNRPDRFEKARQSGADAVILDLEDAVQSTDKDLAREAVVSWLTPARPVYVRINGMGTLWFERDLEVVGLP